MDERPMCELTILMPCLDESATIPKCIDEATAFMRGRGIDGEVLVADNGSTDGSAELAAERGARVVRIVEKGYGHALMGGIRAARGRFVIMGDADESYDFSELDPFVERLRLGDDLVIGNRFRGGIERGAMPALHRYLGNPVLSFLGRLFFRTAVRDFHCGLRGFHRRSILDLDLRTSGMEFASEMVVKATLHRLRVSEVPTVLRPDGRDRPSHLRSWRDGWRHLRFLLLYSPRWLFLYPGGAISVLGLVSTCILVISPVTIGSRHFGAGSLFIAALLAILGYQALLFGVFTKVHGQIAGFLPPDPRFNRWFRFVRLETGLLAGLAMIVGGCLAAAIAYLSWRDSGWGALRTGDNIRMAVPAALGLVLGSQTILSSFFLSILGLSHRESRSIDHHQYAAAASGGTYWPAKGPETADDSAATRTPPSPGG